MDIITCRISAAQESEARTHVAVRMVEEETKSKRPRDTKFTQQKLPAFKPLLTPKVVIIIFAVIAVSFIPIGAVSLAAANNVEEISYRYDDICFTDIEANDNDARDRIISNSGGNSSTSCTITIDVNRKMEEPVFVYYELENYYQNHRRYVKSRSDIQNRDGEDAKTSETATCEPQRYLENDTCSDANEDDCLILPCGLVAWTNFNDSYVFMRTPNGETDSEELEVSSKGISWRSDRNDKFGDFISENFNNDPSVRGGAVIDGPVDEDERFINWMRVAALPRFRKLWGKIEIDLNKGDRLNVTIQNQYNTFRFDGKKRLVLSTSSWIGGKNRFLGIAYLTVGSLSAGLVCLFSALTILKPRPLGDQRYLSWNRKSA